MFRPLGIAFLRGSVAKALSWALVQLTRNGGTLLLREVRHAGALGDVLADEPIGVLVGAAFPGMMRGREVHLRRGRGLECGVPMKLRPVVTGERVDGMRLLPQEWNSASIKFGDGPRPEFAEQEIAGLPLDQTHNAVPIALGTDDGIDFPVADPLAGLHDSRARRDWPLPGEASATVVGAVPFATVFPATPQIRVQGPVCALVGPDVPVDRLVTDPQPTLVAEPASNLLGTPQLAELGMDLSPVRGGEALIPAGSGAASPGVRVGELRAVPAIVTRRIPTDLTADGTAMAAQEPGNGRSGVAVLPESGNSVSFGRGDLCVHGRLHSLGGELKSTSIAGHRFS